MVNEQDTSRGTPYLRIENLTKMFGAFTALKDISLDVYEGEFVCFLGPSGCGKTTLLRCVAGLDIQTSGRVEQAGRDVSGLPPAERDFGIVFQSYALFPNLSVFKNVAYGLENRKLGKVAVRRRVGELLELVGLPEEAQKYPAQLSGGQQQRVALARALAPDPAILLLDEPLAALDAKIRAHLRTEIRGVVDRLGITTVYVTHDQEEALSISDRVAVMDAGRVLQVGAPMEVYLKPTTRFVADFIGTSNHFPGHALDAQTVEVEGCAIQASVPSALRARSDCMVCVRPEHIGLARPRAGTSAGSLPGRLLSFSFLGQTVRARVRTAAGQELLVDMPTADWLAHRLRAEEDVACLVRPGTAMVFAPDGDAGTPIA